MANIADMPIRLDDRIWKKIDRKLSSVMRNYNLSKNAKWSGFLDRKLFIENVLYIVSKKELFSTKLNWNLLQDYSEKARQSQQHRFNKWRRAGIWETILPVFASSEKYYQITYPGRYEIFFRNYRELTRINKLRKNTRDKIKKRAEKKS